jgi:hypothetical protein
MLDETHENLQQQGQDEPFPMWGFSSRFSGLALDEQPSHHRGYSVPSLRSEPNYPGYPQTSREDPESHAHPYATHTPLDSMYTNFGDIWDSSNKQSEQIKFLFKKKINPSNSRQVQ